MHKIIEGNGTGKTRRLMEIAKAEEAIFVCFNPYGMKQKAESYGIIGLTFVTYEDFLYHNNDYRGKKFVIDELEDFVNNTAKGIAGEFVGYTLTKE